MTVLSPARCAPLQQLSLQPVIWDGRNAAGNPVVYTPGDATQTPPGGQGSLVGFGLIQGGTVSPSVSSTTPPGRVQTFPILGARSGYCQRLTTYDTDVPPNKMPLGGASHPSCEAPSPFLIGCQQPGTPVGQSTGFDVYISGSFWLPGTNTRGDTVFPNIPYGGGNFLQLMEVFGQPYNRSPSWSLGVINPSGLTGNYFIMPGILGPGYPYFWQSSAAIVPESWNDWVAHLVCDTQASIDGATHGLVEFWWGPNNTTAGFGATLARQTFRTPYTFPAPGVTVTNGSASVTGLPSGMVFPGTYGFVTTSTSGVTIPANTVVTVTGTGTGTLSNPVTVSGGGSATAALTIQYFNTFNSGQTLAMAQPWSGHAQQVIYDLYHSFGLGSPITVYMAHPMIGTTFASVTPA